MEDELDPAIQQASVEKEEPAIDKRDTDLEDLAKVELTKATISQSIGTLIYPITSEIAKLEVKGINKVKEFNRDRKKAKLLKKNQGAIEEILEKAEEDSSNLDAIEKIYDAVESAIEQDIENPEVAELWSNIISKIKNGNVDVEILKEKLTLLTTAEAKFLIEFYLDKHANVNVNSAVEALSFRSSKDKEYLRNRELAKSLSSKGILEQSFPVVRTILLALMPVFFFLLAAEANRELFSSMSINVSSANNVILMGVLGVMIGIMFLPFIKQRTSLTWIGEELCNGISSENL
ncbi:hypothetical protein SAMN03080615_00066 [Amphritea atlantica]|uniref:Uncharacterized protein n=1 Tax=Amphritea atlantica TaxID=355243 RepID=A0A1H9CPE5_9GAMM|nr:hypothetical protein [Amphritea atlantica]SEQ02513.1 hypothetical protein SAMN03080615_00066 [Amphritea atlantica]